jgi:hypothetical protein
MDIEKQLDNGGNNQEPDSADPASELIDYDGVDDPANPYNWTTSKKWLHGGLLSVMSFVA